MNKCPCCAETLLRHTRQGTVYWFCTHCWQEMPDLAMGIQTKHKQPFASQTLHFAGSAKR